jgi:hypothetical protein
MLKRIVVITFVALLSLALTGMSIADPAQEFQEILNQLDQTRSPPSPPPPKPSTPHKAAPVGTPASTAAGTTNRGAAGRK